MRWLPFALLLTATAAAAAPDPIRIRGRLDGTMARLTVRYALEVKGEWDDRGHELALPHRGVITGARATVGGVTHPLALLQEDKASARFEALKSDSARPGTKPWAVWIGGSRNAASISVASPRAGSLYVELEVTVPTCYLGEVRYIAVPDAWGDVAGAVRIDRVAEDVQINHASGEEGDAVGRWVGFASRAPAKLSSGVRIAATGDRVDLGIETIARIELTLANALADLPRDLATVIVVDGSRSLDSAQREAQRQIVQAYLAAAPASRVQVVAFARSATPLLSAWASAQRRNQIDTALTAWAPQNGSNFDRGLAEASAWLARVKGTKRIVLLTDERMARRLAAMPATELAKQVPAGTLVHAVVLDPDPGTWHRDDTGMLSAFAALTQGMRTRIGPGEPDAPLDATTLVHPTSLDGLAITAPGWSSMGSDGRTECADELALLQGQSCTWWAQSSLDAQPITIEGKIWGTPFRRVVTPASTRTVDLAREAWTHEHLPGAASDAVAELARAAIGRWSLYAQWGGKGTYEVHGGVGWGDVCDHGNLGTIGRGSGTGSGSPKKVQPPLDLRAQLASALATCKLGGERVDVEVELTREEIADVHVRGNPALARCVEEVVWSSAPRIADPKDHQVVTFVAGGG